MLFYIQMNVIALVNDILFQTPRRAAIFVFFFPERLDSSFNVRKTVYFYFLNIATITEYFDKVIEENISVVCIYVNIGGIVII